MTLLMVALGAAVGAPARYLTDRVVQSRHESVMPWGTVSVNVVGSLILGGLMGAGTGVSASVLALLGTGFCGALTTYSTFKLRDLAVDRGGGLRRGGGQCGGQRDGGSGRGGRRLRRLGGVDRLTTRRGCPRQDLNLRPTA